MGKTLINNKKFASDTGCSHLYLGFLLSKLYLFGSQCHFTIYEKPCNWYTILCNSVLFLPVSIVVSLLASRATNVMFCPLVFNTSQLTVDFLMERGGMACITKLAHTHKSVMAKGLK